MVFPLPPAPAVDDETVARFVSLIREEIGNVCLKLLAQRANEAG